MRVHKSYIVVLDKIKEIEGNRIKIGDWTIYVSKANRSQLIQRFSGKTDHRVKSRILTEKCVIRFLH